MALLFYDGYNQSVDGTFAQLNDLDRVVVGRNATLFASGTDALVFGLDNGVTIDIAGEVVSEGGGVAGVSRAGTIRLQATGSLIAATYAIDATGDDLSVVNAGAISGEAGVRLKGLAPAVLNAGSITAYEPAVEIVADYDYFFEGQYGSFVNTGTIVSSGKGSSAVRIYAADPFQLTNGGTIIGRGGAGVELLQNDDVFFPAGQLYLTNTGTIQGRFTSIRGSSYDDHIDNSGQLIGTVYLDGGDDVFDGMAGRTAVAVSGGTGNDSLTGGSAGDYLSGDAGDDDLSGGSGNDTLEGGEGADTLDGGDGRDIAQYFDFDGLVIDLADPTLNTGEAAGDVLISIEGIRGSFGAEKFYGDEAENFLAGDSGSDLLVGRGGDDELRGEDGDDVIEGGLGNDRLAGGRGVDTASYASATTGVTVDISSSRLQNTVGAGRDRLTDIENLLGSAFNDVLSGGAGVNRLDGGDGNDVLNGGDGDDALVAGLGSDAFDGGAGFDFVDYSAANTPVTINLGVATPQNTGQFGTDSLVNVEGVLGGSGNDALTGSTGANRLVGGVGDDTLLGDAGDDTLAGGLGNDTLTGGAGLDTIDYSEATGPLLVRLSIATPQKTGFGTDTITQVENVIGGSGNDRLDGTSIANVLEGGPGDDALNGGAGSDTASYRSAPFSVTVSLAVSGQQNTFSAGKDTLSLIENVAGSDYDDTLTGDGNANRLDGHTGDDTLDGGGGADVLAPGAGTDTITGGDGVDTLTYAGLATRIRADLTTGIVTKGTVFNELTTDAVSGIETFVGTSFADVFTAGSTATTFAGGVGADQFRFARGNANGDTITDFSGATGDGDKLYFTGFGAGRTFTQIDATHWRVSDALVSEVITFGNAPTINIATDVIFS